MKCQKPRCTNRAEPVAHVLVPATLQGLCAEEVAGFILSPEGKAALAAVRAQARAYQRRLSGEGPSRR